MCIITAVCLQAKRCHCRMDQTMYQEMEISVDSREPSKSRYDEEIPLIKHFNQLTHLGWNEIYLVSTHTNVLNSPIDYTSLCLVHRVDRVIFVEIDKMSGVHIDINIDIVIAQWRLWYIIRKFRCMFKRHLATGSLVSLGNYEVLDGLNPRPATAGLW